MSEQPYPVPPFSRLTLEIDPLNLGASLDAKVKLLVVAIPTLPMIDTLISG